MAQDTQRWYKKKAGTEQARSLTEHVSSLRTSQKERTKNNLRFTQMYSNTNISGLNPERYYKRNDDDLLRLNIVKSIVDTLESKIATKQPRAYFLTSGGTYSQKKKAKLLNKMNDGLVYSTGLRGVAARATKDALIYGTGFVYVYEDDGKIKVERAFPDEIVIDEREAFYGEPRSIYRVRTVDRDVVIGMFPEERKKLQMLQQDSTVGMFGIPSTVDSLEIVEAWHLPSSSGAKDGVHTIACGDIELFSEEWTRDTFPFGIIRYSWGPTGFWGTGVVEEVRPQQREINRLLLLRQASMELHSVPHWLVERSSKVVPSQFRNGLGSGIMYTNRPPELVNFAANHPEVEAKIDQLINIAYQNTGVSQLSAQSKKPSGLDSGKALRTFYDIESERFAMFATHFENLFLDISRMFVTLAREIHERTGKFTVNAHSKDRGIEVIDWADIMLPDDDIVMQAWPTDLLPNTPEGKLQTVDELLKMGIVKPELAASLLDFPDTDAQMKRITAPFDIVDRMIELMVDQGIPQAPEPYMDLKLTREQAQLAYLRGRTDGVDPSNLQLVQTFIEKVDELIDAAMAQQQAPPGAPAPGAPTQLQPTGLAQVGA